MEYSELEQTERSFLAAIHKSHGVNSRDWTAALIYADWLEEHSHIGSNMKKAEYIRLLHEGSKIHFSSDADVDRARLDSMAEPLFKKAKAIYKAHHIEWESRLKELGVKTCYEHQGVPVAIEVPAPEFILNGDKIIAECPSVCRLQIVVPAGKISINQEEMKKIANTKALEHFRTVSFQGVGLGDTVLKELLQSPHLRELTSLGLSQTDISSESAFAIARCKVMPKLQILDIGANHIGPNGLKSIIQSKEFPDLQEAYFSSCPISADAISKLDGMLQRRVKQKMQQPPGKTSPAVSR